MPENYLEDVKRLARTAGQAILAIYNNGQFEQYTKDDTSPVTSADYVSNEVLMNGLKSLTPDIPVISEETPASSLAERKQWQRYWLLDPLDGTQEFIAKSGDFAVNIALVEHGWPVLGVIYWPTQDVTYFATKGQGAFKQCPKGTVQISVARHIKDFRVAVSRVQKRELVTQYINDDVELSFIQLGSCSLKNCFVAEGKADCYLRVGPTGEWDTGASHVIVEEAGGKIIDSEFKSLSYNRRETLGNPDFMALGDQTIDWESMIKPHTTSRKL